MSVDEVSIPGARTGFCLAEVLVAAGILAGVVLLATQLALAARKDTWVGRRHTEASRLAGASQEALLTLPLDRQALTVPEGGHELSRDSLWASGSGTWVDPPARDAVWHRTTRVRQFGVSDLYDQPASTAAVLDDPLVGGVDPSNAHLRVVEVVVESVGTGLPGAGTTSRLTLVAIRAF